MQSFFNYSIHLVIYLQSIYLLHGIASQIFRADLK